MARTANTGRQDVLGTVLLVGGNCADNAPLRRAALDHAQSVLSVASTQLAMFALLADMFDKRSR